MLLRLAAGGLVAALITLLILLTTTADPAPPGPDAGGERVDRTVVDAAGAGLPDQPADAALQRQAAAVAANAAEPSARQRPLPRHHRRVRVIDDRTREPVPGAEVAVSPGEHQTAGLAADEWRRFRRTADPFAAAAHFGLCFTADAEGMAIVPVLDRWATLVARDSGRSGRAWVSPELAPEEPVEIRLLPEESFTLTIVDALRRPLPGVPIGVFCERVLDGAEVGGADTDWVGNTDERGILVARSLQYYRQHQSRLRRFELYVTAPGLTHHRVAITTQPAAATLTIPVYGSVAARVVDARGQALPDRPAMLVHLSTDRSAGNHDGETSIWDFAVAGKVEFPYIGVGTALVAYAGRAGEDTTVHTPGPATHGARVEIALSFQKHTTGLRGRLLGDDGQPVPLARLLFVAHAPVPFANSWHATTRADGTFLCDIDPDDLGPVTAVRALAWRDERHLGGSTPIEVRRDTVTDAGDLTLVPGAAIASGVVVGDGPRLPELHAWVERQANRGGRSYWDHTQELSVDIADDGRFTIRDAGQPLDRPLRLRVGAAGCREVPPLPFQPGQHDLRIELHSGVTLRGRVLVDPEFVAMTDGVHARLLQNGEPLDGGVFARSTEWSVVAHGLQPGTATLVLDAAGIELAREENLVIAAGTVDPRVDPLDLRGRLQSLRLRAVDAAGKVVDCRAEVAFRDLRTAAWHDRRRELDHGVLQLPVGTGPLELALFADNTAPIRYEGPPGAIDLQVTALQPVEVTIGGLAGLPTTGRLGAEVEGPPEWAARRNLPPDVRPVSSRGLDRKTGVLSLRVAEAVDITVHLVLRHRGQRTVLATLATRVAPDQPKVTVDLPEADRQKVAAALANSR